MCRLCVPPITAAIDCTATRTMLFSGCWAVSVRAAGLGVEAQQLARLLLGAEALGHQPVPDAAGGTELGDLFEEVVVGVPEEAETGRERVDVHAGGDRRFDVGDAVGDRERDLLHGRAAGFADVVAGDRDRVPLRHVLRRSTRRCR